MKKLCIITIIFFITSIQAQALENGFVKEDRNGVLKVWNTTEKDWSNIELFWQRYSIKNKAKSWGSATTYPNYSDVNEFDTFLIELKEGSCLMQFYHSRWRRANDVRRWNDAFNEYSGCPYVFG